METVLLLLFLGGGVLFVFYFGTKSEHPVALRVWRGGFPQFGSFWECIGKERRGDVDSIENCRSENIWDKAEAPDS